MKVKRRETRCFGDDLEFERLIQIPQDEVDRSIDSLDVIEGFTVGFFSTLSQDL